MSDSPQAPGFHILVVDDEPEILDLLREILEEHGFRVSTAASGEEALEHIRQGRPADLVLMDVVMGGISGLETMERTHELRQELPVVLISGASPATRPWPPPGAAGFLPKPLDTGKLLALLRSLVR